MPDNQSSKEKEKPPEPWLRGTHADVHAVQRAVLHALELAAEDIEKWCGGLTDEQLNARPMGVPPVAFHVRHIARSLNRLLTYVEGKQLTQAQLDALKSELDPGAKRAELFAEFAAAMAHSALRVRAMDINRLEESRLVGSKQLLASMGGLLVHLADHTQRHVGQAVTTAKIVVAHK